MRGTRHSREGRGFCFAGSFFISSEAMRGRRGESRPRRREDGISMDGVWSEIWRYGGGEAGSAMRRRMEGDGEEIGRCGGGREG